MFGLHDRHKLWKQSLWVVLWLLFDLSFIEAQTNTAQIAGTVKDSTAAVTRSATARALIERPYSQAISSHLKWRSCT